MDESFLFPIRKSRLNPGYLAIPRKHATRLFPSDAALIHVCLGADRSPTDFRFVPAEGPTKEARIYGMKKWFDRERLAGGEMLRLALLSREHLLYRLSRNVRDAFPAATEFVTDEDADEGETSGSAPYIPEDVDRRRVVERQIRQRRGQQDFRNALRKRYGDRCLVTGCKAIAVLEAAHIKAYQGEGDNHPENGLLLRADIHTLFDIDLLGVEPDGLRVQLHPSLGRDYAQFAGRTLGCKPGQRPSKEALELRYELFQERLHQDG